MWISVTRVKDYFRSQAGTGDLRLMTDDRRYPSKYNNPDKNVNSRQNSQQGNQRTEHDDRGRIRSSGSRREQASLNQSRSSESRRSQSSQSQRSRNHNSGSVSNNSVSQSSAGTRNQSSRNQTTRSNNGRRHDNRSPWQKFLESPASKVVMAVLLIIVIVAIVLVIRKAKGSGQSDASVEGASISLAAEDTGDTIVFAKNGLLEVSSVESFGEDYYDSSELKTNIDKEISDYNGSSKASEKNAVEASDLVADNGAATVKIKYASVDDYCNFNEAQLFVGTVGDARSAGYDLSGLISAVSQEDTEKILTSSDLETFSDSTIVILTNPAKFEVPSKIMYASKNVKITDEKTGEATEDSSEADPALILLKN